MVDGSNADDDSVYAEQDEIDIVLNEDMEENEDADRVCVTL